MGRRIGLVVALISAVALLAACGSGAAPTQAPSGGGPTSAPTQPPTGGDTTVEVTIVNFAFSPATVNITVGGTVTWTNKDGTTHTVTADGGAFDSGNLDSGKTFSFTFNQAGTFSYHCAIHPSMKATVTVTQ